MCKYLTHLPQSYFEKTYSSTTANRTHGEPDITENGTWIFQDSA